MNTRAIWMAVATASFLGCAGEPGPAGKAAAAPVSQDQPAAADTSLAQLVLDRNPWMGCVATVRGALKPLPGIFTVAIEAGQPEFDVRYDPRQVDLDAMLTAIREAGEGVQKRDSWSTGEL